MSQKRVRVIVVGVMLSLFLAAVESTVIATAMPTIVAELGGLASYSWVFSAYMLTSTTTMPLYGKLSDLYGRRRIYYIAMALFLGGSILSGLAQNMGQLIAFRALQGLGAGGLNPLAFIMIGDILSYEQRAKMQGLFSGVWGFASIVGPLLGGFLVDQLSWHWVFYVNIIPGLLATLLVGVAWRDRPRAANAVRPNLDLGGVALLSGGVVALLIGLFELGQPLSLPLLFVSAVLFVALYFVERRAPDPVLPLPLFRDRLFTVATVQGLLAGWAMFGSTNYVPLFGQAVLGISATAAGSALMPMMLSWTFASIVGTRLLLRIGHRTISIAGMVLLLLGALLLTQVARTPSLALVFVSLGIMGFGMGLTLPAFLIAVQNAVRKPQLGTATAMLQFSRNIGGTLGVSIMGVILASRTAANLLAVGVDPDTVSMSELIRGGPAGAVDATLRNAIAGGVASVFMAAAIAALFALIITMLTPRMDIRARRAPDARATDARATDARATDVRATDVRAPDARATDARATDARATDARATDARATDARATDVRAPDARATDARATDVRAPDAPIAEPEYGEP